MRFFRFTLIATVLLLGLADAANAQADAKSAELDVRKLERAWLDAYEKHDTKAMTAIVADDFLITFSDGSRQTKPQILAMIGRPADPVNGNKFTTEKVTSRVYGDTVILSGIVVTESKRDGKVTRELSSYTDTYIRRNGQWQVVASHLSNAPPEPKKN